MRLPKTGDKRHYEAIPVLVPMDMSLLAIIYRPDYTQAEYTKALYMRAWKRHAEVPRGLSGQRSRCPGM